MQGSNTPSEPISDPIELLLQRGLDHYGRGEVPAAVQCWMDVLKIDPLQEQARDYLDTAGYASDVAPGAEVIDLSALRTRSQAPEEPRDLPPDSTPPSRLLTPEGQLADPRLKQLLKEKRYEEALKMLYAARSEYPWDAGISRSIRLLREKLTVIYATQLTNLDRIPTLVPDAERSRLSGEQRQVLALVDGISSYGDIVSASAMGRVVTLRVLCELLELGLFTVATPSVSPAAHSDTHTRLARVSGPVPSRPNSPPRTSGVPPRSMPAPQTHNVDVPVDGPLSSNSDYGLLFRLATEAYLLRDYEKALSMFEQCCAERPADTKARHNLNALKRRLGRS